MTLFVMLMVTYQRQPNISANLFTITETENATLLEKYNKNSDGLSLTSVNKKTNTTN